MFLPLTEDGKRKDLREFVIERYFAKYEFTTPYQLSCSDSEPINLKEILDFLPNEPKPIQDLWNNLSLCYTTTQGHEVLREEISDYYNKKV